MMILKLISIKILNGKYQFIQDLIITMVVHIYLIRKYGQAIMT